MKDSEFTAKDEKTESGGRNIPVMAVIFPVLSLLALLFVFWLGFSSFESNSYDITKSLYQTILAQSVSDIESATRYGKTLESFFGIDRLLAQTTSFMRAGVNAAVTDQRGRLLYATFDDDSPYAAIIEAEYVRTQIEHGAPDRFGAVISYGGYELLVMPILGQHDQQSGNMCLIYPARDPSFSQEHGGGMFVMTIIIAACVIAAILIWLLICGKTGSVRLRKLTGVLPVVILTAGILVQSALSFVTYQAQYRNMILGSAQTVSSYLESLVSQVRDKGVPYERMQGLDEFFAEKLRQMPTLWDIKLVSVLADSRDVMFRENDFIISMAIEDEGQWDMRLEITISTDYMNRRMVETLLLSLITLVVCVVAVVEVMRLPELIMLKVDKSRNDAGQWAGVRSGLRLTTFLMYTGMYIIMPFSAMLVRQWQQTMFGLSIEVTAGIPLTLEVFSLMIGTIASAVLLKRLKIKAGLGASIIIFIGANLACLLIMNPYWLSILRFVSGLGFSGILYTSNYIVSHVSREGSGRAAALAGINSGLLGGIMVGASLGAIIASTLSVALCFVVAASLCAAAGIIRFTLTPWKRLTAEVQEEGSAAKKAAIKSAYMAKKLTRAGIIAYFLLVMAPLSFGLMFVAAGMPAFARANGLSPLILSSGYIVNGLAGIYLGLPILKLLTRKLPGNALITVTLLIGGGAMAVIFLPMPGLMLLICALLLGLFDGIGSPTVMFRFLELPGMQGIPLMEAMAAGNTFMRAVGAASPVALGLIIASATQNSAVYAVMGGAFAAAAIIYMFINRALTNAP